MAAPLLPLENGPSTIFNQKPALIDPVALEVGRMLETHSQVLRTQGNLELEVRLGILKSVKSSSAPLNSRVDLPILSEAMLIPRCEEFHYRFQAGLPPEIYAALLQKLEIMRRDHHVDYAVSSDECLDVTYDPEDGGRQSQLRVTYHRQTTPEGESRWFPEKTMRKNRYEVLDLFTGRSAPQRGPTYDLRVALSAEMPSDARPRPNTHTVKMKREKQRKSLDFKAWRIDFTTVRASGADPKDQQVSYEVELELNSQMLHQNLEAKLENKQHKLWELLMDFLNTARDLGRLAAELPRAWQMPPSPLPPLPPDEGMAAYAAQLPGKPAPLIGHYLYRLAEKGDLRRARAAPRDGELSSLLSPLKRGSGS
ncbi:Polynucleotide 5'-triphosphatase (mRNA 5'-triphosphatase) [Durusdinium trenchii]|uniref:mRNA 5'-phosphatase n=1 Tax=Durusdinium trenchii TaxID=1381693 RepID=A0ABP0P088_9DINO